MDLKKLMKDLGIDYENSDMHKIQMAHDVIVIMNRLDRKMTPEELEEYLKALNTIAYYLCNGYVLIELDRANKYVKMEMKELLNNIYGKDNEDD